MNKNKRRNESGFFIFSGLLVSLLWLFSPCLYGQKDKIRFKHTSIEDGLSQVCVTCILQDSKGFIWVGTLDGLDRYDGYTFKHYKHDPKDPTTLSNNRVRAICEDTEGNLWIGTMAGGLNRFDPQTETFTQYKPIPGDPTSLSHSHVYCILMDHSGDLWVGTYGGGLDRFDHKNECFIHHKYNKKDIYSISDNRILAIYEDKAGFLWIGTMKGLNRLNLNRSRFLHYTSATHRLSDNRVTAVFEDPPNHLLIGTKGGLNRLNRLDKSIEYYTHDPNESQSLSNNQVTSIFQDSSGKLWVGTYGGGLNRFDRQTGRFIHYTQDETKTSSLSDNRVMCVLEDHSGVLWIGTLYGGLNRLYLESTKFTHYKREPANINSLSNNDVLAIYEDRSGNLWIGTDGGGLNRLDQKRNKFKHYKHDSNNRSSLGSNIVYAIHEDHQGVLWIGTKDSGLNQLDKETGRFIRLKHDPSVPGSLSFNDVTVIYEDKKGNLWIGTSGGGLNLFNRETKKFNSFQDDGSSQSLSDNRVRAIHEDHLGMLWVGTVNGLNRFDRNNRGFTKYYNVFSKSRSLSHNHINCIHEDSSNTLWIGTYGGGLNKFDHGGSEFHVFLEKDGLPSNAIYGILEDSKGNLWMSTNKGICRFNPKTKTFRNFEMEDGLQSNEFNALAYFKSSKSGEMFFGGINGFNSFFPEKITDNLNPPRMVITNFYLLDRKVPIQRFSPDSPLKTPIHLTESLTLSPNQNFFSFEFAALHYVDPGRNQYKYKMENWDKEWIDTDSKNKRATYHNLPAGNYVFRVIGSNKDGIWDKTGASITLKIPPPWWKSWWAYSLYALTLILFISFITFRLVRSKNILAHRVEERTKELKDAQSQLVQSEKMASLGTLVAGIAHEINNPTSFAHTGAYNLERDIKKLKAFLIELAGDDADNEMLNVFNEKFSHLYDHLAAIKDGTSRISKIVSDLRIFSRMEKKEMKRIKILEGLQVTINLIKTQYKDKVDFVTDFQADPEVEGNAAELNQVFMNILINACQAILEKQKGADDKLKGTITIQALEEKENAVIRFQDTGIGMSEKVKNKMFDPFFTTKSVGEGTGLGLSITYNIVEKHKGRLEVISKEGEGTTITLYIPHSLLKTDKKEKD